MDFNFFDPYKKPEFHSDSLKTIVKVVWFLLTVALVGFSVNQVLIMNKLNKEINSMNKYLTDEENVRKLAEHKDKIKQRDDLKRENISFKALNIISNIENVGAEDIFDLITTNTVDGVFVDSITLTEGKYALIGVASDLDRLGNFEANLRATNVFSKINVTSAALNLMIDSEVSNENETQMATKVLDLHPFLFNMIIEFDQIGKILDTNEELKEDIKENEPQNIEEPTTTEN